MSADDVGSSAANSRAESDAKLIRGCLGHQHPETGVWYYHYPPASTLEERTDAACHKHRRS